MARMHWLGLVVVSLSVSSLTGCVAQDKYGAVKLSAEQLREQLVRAQMDGESARKEAEIQRNLVQQLTTKIELLEAQRNNGQSSSAQLEQEIAALKLELEKAYA